MKDSATRQKILEATIESIEKHGIEGCTIRNIAKEAGVTFSSLHYYFESKEQLVEGALMLALDNSFEDLVQFWETRADDQAALSEMLQFLFDGAIRFPGVTRASLHSLLMTGNPEGMFLKRLNGLLGEILDALSTKHGLDREKLALRISNAFSTVVFLGIAPRAFADSSSLDFQDAERRRQMVGVIVENLLNP